MVLADSARMVWFPAIPLVKADPQDRAPAEDAAGRVAVDQAEEAASAGQAEEVVVSGELLAEAAECLEVEEVAAPVAAGAED